MIEQIVRHLSEDPLLRRHLETAIDYARVYYFAKMRQKGCDGLGEMTNLKDEFKGVLEEMLAYCLNKGYIDHNLSYDIDAVTDELSRGLLAKKPESNGQWS